MTNPRDLYLAVALPPLAIIASGCSAGGGAPTVDEDGPPTVSAGGSSGASSAEAGGSGDPLRTYDPNVRFDWPVTVPTNSPCLPGNYVGQYSCTVAFVGLFPATVLSGAVSFTLEPSADGEFLEIRDGEMGGNNRELNLMWGSPIAGELDCGADVFEARATNGTYSDGLLLTGTFTGSLEANLDRQTQTLTGSWSLGSPGNVVSCSGPWSAGREP